MRRTKCKESDAEVEEVLGSSGRLRVLKFLVRNPTNEPSLTVSRLRRLTGLRRGSVEKHLVTLMKWSWVEEIPINGGKKYKLRRENPKVEASINYFRKVGYV